MYTRSQPVLPLTFRGTAFGVVNNHGNPDCNPSTSHNNLIPNRLPCYSSLSVVGCKQGCLLTDEWPEIVYHYADNATMCPSG